MGGLGGAGTGSLIGTAIGIALYFVPYVGAILGTAWIAVMATLGGIIGGLLFPPEAPDIDNPLKAQDFSFNTFQRNLCVPFVAGLVKSFGNVIWIGNVGRKVVKDEIETGEKGEPITTKHFKYFADWAIGFGEGIIGWVKAVYWKDRDFTSKEGTRYVNRYGTPDQTAPLFNTFGPGRNNIDKPERKIGDTVPNFRNTAHMVWDRALGRMNTLPIISADIFGGPFLGEFFYMDIYNESAAEVFDYAAFDRTNHVIFLRGAYSAGFTYDLARIDMRTGRITHTLNNATLQGTEGDLVYDATNDYLYIACGADVGRVKASDLTGWTTQASGVGGLVLAGICTDGAGTPTIYAGGQTGGGNNYLIKFQWGGAVTTQNHSTTYDLTGVPFVYYNAYLWIIDSTSGIIERFTNALAHDSAWLNSGAENFTGLWVDARGVWVSWNDGTGTKTGDHFKIRLYASDSAPADVDDVEESSSGRVIDYDWHYSRPDAWGSIWIEDTNDVLQVGIIIGGISTSDGRSLLLLRYQDVPNNESHLWLIECAMPDRVQAAGGDPAEEYYQSPVWGPTELVCNDRFGMGATAIDRVDFYINWKSSKVAAEILTGDSAYKRRFTLDYNADRQAPITEHLQAIMISFNGYPIIVDGKFAVGIEWTEPIRMWFADRVVVSGTADGGSTTTLEDSTIAGTYPDDFFNWDAIKVTISSVDYFHVVKDFDGTNGIFTIYDTAAGSMNGCAYVMHKSNISRDSFGFSEVPSSKITNRVEIDFINRDDDHRHDLAYAEDQFHQQMTGLVKVHRVFLPGCRVPNQASRIARQLCSLNIQGRLFAKWRAGLIASALSPGDVVAIVHSVGKWTYSAPLYMRIHTIVEKPTMEVEITARQYVEAIYSDATGVYEASASSNDQFGDPYAVPDHVENLDGWQRLDMGGFIEIVFSEGDATRYSDGAYIYYSYDDSDYIYIGHAPYDAKTATVKTSIDENETTEVIYENEGGDGGFDAADGKIRIGNEVIGYSAWDEGNTKFTTLTRGMLGTDAVPHGVGEIISEYFKPKNNKVFRWAPAIDDDLTADVIYFKAVAVNCATGDEDEVIMASTVTAPTVAITLSMLFEGDRYEPSPISLLQINSQKQKTALPADTAAVFTWCAVNSQRLRGWGQAKNAWGIGAGWGGGSEDDKLDGFEVEIWDAAGSVRKAHYTKDSYGVEPDDGIGLRPGRNGKFTVSEAMNLALFSGVFQANFTFKVYQRWRNNKLSTAESMVTNS